MATSRRGTDRRAAGYDGAPGGVDTSGRQLAVRDGARPVPLDDIARKIIELLRRDGRRPYASIGRAVGLSEAAVRQRVQRLLDAGVIQIVAVSDPTRLGLRRQALIGVRAAGDLEEAAARIAELDEVADVVVTAGSFDLFTEVTCRDDDHLLEILRQLRAVAGVSATEVFVYLTPRRQTWQTWQHCPSPVGGHGGAGTESADDGRRTAVPAQR